MLQRVRVLVAGKQNVGVLEELAADQVADSVVLL